MPWIQAHLTTDKQKAPLVELLFENMGALSITLLDAEDEPLLEPNPGELPLWQHTRVTGLFDGDTDLDGLRSQINQALNSDVTANLRIELLEDQAWERAWLENFKAMRFGQRLWICPQGQQADSDHAVVVELDPGLAFGTGTHPTTALCLEWLDEQSLADKTILDFGCGSGILAVAALRLGAEQVTATDHDAQALQASRDNALKNSVSERLTLYDSTHLPREPVDILLANILAGTLIELETLFAELTQPGGTIVLSGILTEQAQAVSSAFTNDFIMQPPRILEDWVLLEGARRHPS